MEPGAAAGLLKLGREADWKRRFGARQRPDLGRATAGAERRQEHDRRSEWRPSQRPVNTALRFSTKAVTPSLKSSRAAHVAKASASAWSCDSKSRRIES